MILKLKQAILTWINGDSSPEVWYYWMHSSGNTNNIHKGFNSGLCDHRQRWEEEAPVSPEPRHPNPACHHCRGGGAAAGRHAKPHTLCNHMCRGVPTPGLTSHCTALWETLKDQSDIHFCGGLGPLFCPSREVYISWHLFLWKAFLEPSERTKLKRRRSLKNKRVVSAPLPIVHCPLPRPLRSRSGFACGWILQRTGRKLM